MNRDTRNHALPRQKISTTVRSNIIGRLIRTAFGLGSWLAPETTAARAGRLFATPLAATRRAAGQPLPADGRRVDVDADGHRVVAYVWGEPARQPYVLFSHGWSSHGLRIDSWLPALTAAGYAVVGFDQFAHGRSPGRQTTLPGFRDHLLAVGRRFGPAAAVIGHSLGGAATMLALEAGLRADRVVLVAPAADPIDASRRFAGMIGLAAHVCRRMRAQFESRLGIRFEDMQAHTVVPHLAQPALVVHDLRDREVPWSEGERYARFWPHARLLTTDGLGHRRILDDPEVIRAGVDFIEGRTVGDRIVSTQDLPYGFA
ncbi:alpha/beta fold hydrolase [Lysobacter maris]|uniref:Alpha/beta fold hydrolase n=1 Tax=Marilutibacter maris TaxID=1605891 RepID=A0A508B410_9GAMM|nr:alpha/beta fold hydrolase [Lysobacter maris]KAB8192491.1 alpha/beta fold hydrolase [Lysobacter maris]